MLLKTKAAKLRNFFSAVSYRIPLSVKKMLLLNSGTSYPICPRCDHTVDREYIEFCDRCGQHLSWNQYEFATIVFAPKK